MLRIFVVIFSVFGVCASDEDEGTSLMLSTKWGARCESAGPDGVVMKRPGVWKARAPKRLKPSKEKPKRGHARSRTNKMTKQAECTDKVLQYFQAHPGVMCTDNDLFTALDGDNDKRALYNAIVALRQKGFCIFHVCCPEEGFIYSYGPWKMREDSYEKAVWEMMCADGKKSRYAGWNFLLHLSDLGYDPVWSRVHLLRTIKSFLSGDPLRLSAENKRRRELWHILLRERCVYDVDYYTQHADMPYTPSARDVCFVRKCWMIFQSVFFGYRGNLSPKSLAIKDYLRENPGGVSESQLNRFLCKKTEEDVDLWTHISILMGNGYAGNVIFSDGRFFWDDDGPVIPLRKEAVFEDFYSIARKTLHRGFLIFYMYKMGHFNLSYWQIKKMKAALYLCWYGPLSKCKLAKAWGSVCRKERTLQDFPWGIRRNLEFMMHLKTEGLLDDIKQGKPVDCEKFFQEKIWRHVGVFSPEEGVFCGDSLALERLHHPPKKVYDPVQELKGMGVHPIPQGCEDDEDDLSIPCTFAISSDDDLNDTLFPELECSLMKW